MWRTCTTPSPASSTGTPSACRALPSTSVATAWRSGRTRRCGRRLEGGGSCGCGWPCTRCRKNSLLSNFIPCPASHLPTHTPPPPLPQKLIDLQNSRGGRVRLAAITQPESEYDHPEKGGWGRAGWRGGRRESTGVRHEPRPSGSPSAAAARRPKHVHVHPPGAQATRCTPWSSPSPWRSSTLTNCWRCGRWDTQGGGHPGLGWLGGWLG